MLGSPSSNFIEIVRRRKNLFFRKWRRKALCEFWLGNACASSNHDGYVAFISSSIHGDGIQAIYSGMG